MWTKAGFLFMWLCNFFLIKKFNFYIDFKHTEKLRDLYNEPPYTHLDLVITSIFVPIFAICILFYRHLDIFSTNVSLYNHNNLFVSSTIITNSVMFNVQFILQISSSTMVFLQLVCSNHVANKVRTTLHYGI